MVEKLSAIFDENGINVIDPNAPLELDSMQFISIIVSIEDTFQIEVPDNYLSEDQLVNFNDFLAMVESVINY